MMIIPGSFFEAPSMIRERPDNGHKFFDKDGEGGPFEGYHGPRDGVQDMRVEVATSLGTRDDLGANLEEHAEENNPEVAIETDHTAENKSEDTLSRDGEDHSPTAGDQSGSAQEKQEEPTGTGAGTGTGTRTDRGGGGGGEGDGDSPERRARHNQRRLLFSSHQLPEGRGDGIAGRSFGIAKDAGVGELTPDVVSDGGFTRGGRRMEQGINEDSTPPMMYVPRWMPPGDDWNVAFPVGDGSFLPHGVSRRWKQARLQLPMVM